MKTKILFVFLLCSTVLFSQENTYKKNLEELKSKKISFITERIQLTPEEAQAFWPLYNEMQLKKAELNKKIRQQASTEKLSNESYEKMNEEKIDAQVKKALLEKEYYLKYKQILSAEKIYNLYKAEREFRRELLKEIHERQAKK